MNTGYGLQNFVHWSKSAICEPNRGPVRASSRDVPETHLPVHGRGCSVQAARRGCSGYQPVQQVRAMDEQGICELGQTPARRLA